MFSVRIAYHNAFMPGHPSNRIQFHMHTPKLCIGGATNENLRLHHTSSLTFPTLTRSQYGTITPRNHSKKNNTPAKTTLETTLLTEQHSRRHSRPSHHNQLRGSTTPQHYRQPRSIGTRREYVWIFQVYRGIQI